jgi:hypothetical protein
MPRTQALIELLDEAQDDSNHATEFATTRCELGQPAVSCTRIGEDHVRDALLRCNSLERVRVASKPESDPLSMRRRPRSALRAPNRRSRHRATDSTADDRHAPRVRKEAGSPCDRQGESARQRRQGTCRESWHWNQGDTGDVPAHTEHRRDCDECLR